MRQTKLFKLENKYLLSVYKRQKVVFVRGRGKYLFDSNGKKYLDFFAGLSVCNLGHNHPKIVQAIKSQLSKVIHISNLYYSPAQVELAKILVSRSFPSGGKLFFSNSGAEANECAIKLTRRFGAPRGRYQIIVFKNSFHGRTLATLSATEQKKVRQGFHPLVLGFRDARLNDISSVRKYIGPKTCAIMIEPIQGEGGICPADKKFLLDLRKLCNQHKLLLIFDEIQCGLGRTGKLFAYQYYGVEPDIVTIAKSIANGLPLGVTIVKNKFSKIFKYGDHGSTFGGNLVSCTAASEVLNIIDNRLLNKVTKLGKYFINQLNKLKSRYSFIKEVRGIGLMLGVELSIPGGNIVKECLNNGLVINCTQEKVLRFLPPFIIDFSDIDKTIKILDKIFKTERRKKR